MAHHGWGADLRPNGQRACGGPRTSAKAHSQDTDDTPEVARDQMAWSSFERSRAASSGTFGDTTADHWTFTSVQDTALGAVAGVLAKVRFSQSGWADDAFAFEVYDGSTWTPLATYDPLNPPPTTLTTLSYDASSILTTAAQVNAAQLRLIGAAKEKQRDTITLSVDGARLGIEPPPTPTPTPTATPTPTPTPTSVPPTGTTDIEPSYWSDANPGETMTYSHTVTNEGGTFDTKDITTSSSQGWTVTLWESDGITQLSDHNGNGIPDTDRLNSGVSATIIVKVTVPPGTLRDTVDVTTVTANSGRNPGPDNSDSATDTTTVLGLILMSLSTATITFGEVSPDGHVDPGATGVTSTSDDQGAYYVMQGELLVTVTSNAAWNGYCRGQENTGSAGTLLVVNGDLEWRLAGDSTWAAFLLDSESPPYDNSCFAARSTGDNPKDYDFRLRVDWADDPGTVSFVVVFAAVQ